MRQVFYLSVAPSPPMTPNSSLPPYYNLYRYTCIQYTHREGGGEGERANQREG
jgi:hypothetical protein